MIKISVKYNKEFSVIPDGLVNVDYDTYVEDDQLSSFISELDTTGVQSINISYNVEIPSEEENNEVEDYEEDVEE